MKDNRVLIGTVVKPHGVDGTLLVEVLTDYPEERFSPGAPLRIEKSGKEITCTVEEAGSHGERWRVRVDQCSDRDRAEELRDARIVILEEDVIGTGDELYDFDLIGMQVFDTDDRERGMIRDVTYYGPRALLEVHPDSGESFDFPAHEDLVVDFDRDEGWIQLKFPKGWEG